MEWWMCKIIHSVNRGLVRCGDTYTKETSAVAHFMQNESWRPHRPHTICTPTFLDALGLHCLPAALFRALQASLCLHPLSPGPTWLAPFLPQVHTWTHTLAHWNTAGLSLPPYPLSFSLLERSPQHLSPSDTLFICPFIKVKGQKGRDYAFITNVPS